MSKNLVPVQRTDRNGVTVTRWVRPEGSASNTGKKIPSPDAAARKAKVRSIRDVFFPGASYAGDLAKQVKIISHLEKTMPDVLGRMVEAARADSDMAENFRSMLEYQSLISDPKEYNRGILENMLVVHPFTKKVMVDVLREQDPDWIRDTMFRTEKAVSDMKAVSGYVNAATVKAMVLVALMENGSDGISVDSGPLYTRAEEDIKYIAAHIDEVEGILPLLAERGSYDRHVIHELISAPSKAFTSGAL